MVTPAPDPPINHSHRDTHSTDAGTTANQCRITGYAIQRCHDDPPV